MTNEQHIVSLRVSVREERERIARLNAKFGDGLRQLLKRASAHLDDVEQFFFNSQILSGGRTPQKLAQWLAHADTYLKIGIETRKSVEEMADKFGPDAKLL